MRKNGKAIFSGIICVFLIMLAVGYKHYREPIDQVQKQIQRRSRPAEIPLLGFMKTYHEDCVGNKGRCSNKETGWQIFLYDLPWDEDKERGLHAQLKRRSITAFNLGRSKTKKIDIRSHVCLYWRTNIRGLCDNPPTLPILLYWNSKLQSRYGGDDEMAIAVGTEKQMDLLAKARPGTLFLPTWLNGEHWMDVRDKLILQAKPKEIAYLEVY